MTRTVIEYVAHRIADAAEGLSFGAAVAQVERINDDDGWPVDGLAEPVRLSDQEFLAAVVLVLTWYRDPSASAAQYVGRSGLAAYLGVPYPTFTSWLRRYAASERPPPAADVDIVEHTARGRRVRRGWSPERAVQVHRWVREELPTLRGVGGWPKGRPRPKKLENRGVL